ncbi:MAG: electron transfer flavoprotein subunit beta/FixA family protein [Bacillota bacterium]
MRIAVLMKQVPGTSNVAIDPEKGTLRRESASTKTNPFDLHALEAALDIKSRLIEGQQDGRAAGDHGACGQTAPDPTVTVSVISMGPPQAEAVIRESYWMGADSGTLMTDRAFAGADTLATAFALSQALRAQGFDLIIAGMQSTDGDTAQVGPGVAEFLGIPHVSYVRSIDRVGTTSVEVTADLGDRYQSQEVALPCLITVTRDLNQPRLPSFQKRKETAGRTVDLLKAADLPPADEQYLGLLGSPTRVERIFPPVRKRVREMWEGAPEELAEKLAALLKEVQP